uniref:Nucleoprotein n=1 Tax=Hymenopteran phenui-related virus OKIAV275 TaxID=2792548 RepID=A0A7T0Q5U2_9VIRU|nr:nucleoprotein [Hymenopteran phenui-related virus OKIAV275]
MATPAEVTSFLTSEAPRLDNGVVAAFTDFAASVNAETGDLDNILSLYELSRAESVISLITEKKSIYEFQGFNPKDMSLVLYSAYKSFRGSGMIDLGEGNTYNKMASFSDDMANICAIFTMRGANWENILKKSTEGLKRLMTHLRVKYNINIVKRNAKSRLDPKTVTLARIAACMPQFTVKAYISGLGRELTPMKKLFPGLDGLPKALCSPMVLSILPTDNFRPVAAAFFYVSYMTDRVLHSKDKDYTDPSSLSDYFFAAHKSTVLEDPARVFYCKNFDLITENGAWNPLLITAAKRVEANMAGDEYLTEFISRF